MRFVTDQGETLAALSLSAESTGECLPTTTMGPYQVEGPRMDLSIQKDEEGDGLLVKVSLPDLIEMGIVIEKEDVKQLKGLMNKDAIGFMVKAFMK